MAFQPVMPLYNSHDNNMGIVRYYLSGAVVVAHVAYLGGYNLSFITTSEQAVGGFFAMSGYLMYGSYGRKPNLGNYVRKRLLRIVPPYFFIVLLAALALCFVSCLPFGEYFSDKGLYGYLAANLSFLNFLHPALPGVFQGHGFTTDAVNGSLWTMKCEWVCYMSIPLIYWLLARTRIKAAWLLVGIIVAAAIYRWWFLGLYEQTGNKIYEILARQFVWMMSYFCVGALICVYKKQFLENPFWTLFWLLILVLWGDRIPTFEYWGQPVIIGSLVLWFSLVGKWGTWEAKYENISYELYLYHWPVIQLGVYLGLNSVLDKWGFLAYAYAATILLALTGANLTNALFRRKNAVRGNRATKGMDKCIKNQR